MKNKLEKQMIMNQTNLYLSKSLGNKELKPFSRTIEKLHNQNPKIMRFRELN